MSGDGTYAPRSPDLSSFYAAGPTAEPAQPQQLFSSQQSQPNFSQRQPPSSAPADDTHHPSSHNNQQQQPHARHQSQQYSYPTPSPFPPQSQPITNPGGSQAPGFGAGVGYSPSAHHEYYPPRAASYPATGYSQLNTGYTAAQTPATQQQQQPQPPQPSYQPLYRGSLPYQFEQPQQLPTPTPYLGTAPRPQVHSHYDPHAPASRGDQQLHDQPPDHPMPPRRAAAAAAAAAVASQTAMEAAGGESLSPAGPSGTIVAAIEPSPVKTKFPTARIKRIMQADEEVGKVAQQTPIAVGKALELFMVALVTKSAEAARQRNSKRVSAQMLKQVVESDDQWDFLRDIVAKVDGEEKSGKGHGGKVKAESSETDEEMGGADHAGASGAKKKAGRGGGRKKKI